MKVLVPIKRVIDPYVKIIVRRDGSGVEDENVKQGMNPFDEIAIEEAMQWKEKGIVQEVVVVSVGTTAAQETLRQALALGADKAIHYLTEEKLLPLQVASVLKRTVEAEQPDIIIMGKQAIDDDCNQVAQILAGQLNWPQATFASKIEFEGNKTLCITREVDGGLEQLRVQSPAVISTDLRLNEPRYPTLPNIMKAKRKPLEIVNLSDADIVDVKYKCERVTSPPPRQAGIKVGSVDELLTHLRVQAKVLA